MFTHAHMSESTAVPDTLAAELASARRAYDSGHLEQAFEIVRLMLGKSPTHASAIRLRAKLHSRREQWSDAAADYDALCAAGALEIADVPDLIHCGRRTGDLPGALRRAQALASHFPQSSALRVEIGDLFRDLGNVERAEAAYQSLITDDPKSVTARLKLGYCIRSRLGADQALPHFKAAVEVAPSDRWARLALADTLRDTGALVEAESEYRQVLEAHPSFFQAHLGLGYLVRRRAGTQSALSHFEAALAVAPKDRSVRLAVADSRRELGQLNEAETLFREIVQDEPRAHQAHLGLAHCIRARSGMAKAFTHFEQALALAPQDPWCRLYVADGLRELGRWDDAEAAYRAMVAADALPVLSRIGLGHCLRHFGRLNEAVDEFLAALQRAPQDSRARAAALDSLSELQRWDEALALIDSWLADSPGSGTALLSRARVLRRRDGLAAAIQAYRQAVDALGRDVGALREVAAAFREAGDLPRAEAIYARLILENPKDTHARIGLAQCSFERRTPDVAMVQLADGIHAGFPDKHAALEVARLAREWANLDLARKALNRALEGPFTDDADLWASMGAIESAAGASESAIAAYRRALQSAPHRHEFALAIASEQVAAGGIADADETLAALCAVPDLPSEVLAKVAEHHLRCGLDSAALDYAIEAHESDRRCPAAVMALARVLSLGGHVDAALEVLEDGAERFGVRSEFYGLGSVILRERGRLDGARELLADFLGKHAPTPWVAFEQVLIELEAGRLDDASSRLDQIRVLSRRDLAQALSLRGQLAVERWQLEEAAARFEDSVRECPELGQAHHSLAICCLLLGRTDQARIHAQAFTDAEAPQRRARGRPLSVWYSQLGQLLDEYSFDRSALARLESLASRPVSERLESLRATGAEMLLHTPSAITLLVTLRRADLLTGPVVRLDAGTQIPPLLMQFWHEATVPDDLEPYMASWQERNPDLTYCPLDDAAAQEFLQSHCAPEVLEAYRRATEPTRRADLIRLAWLHVNGGFYADVDDVCLRAIRDFVPASAQLVSSQESYGTLLNNFLGAVPRHPVIETALKAAVEATNRGDADRLWLSTGPALLTRAFAAVWASGTDVADHLLETSFVMTRAELARNVTAHCQAAYKRNPRHWSLVEPKLVRRRTDWSRPSAAVIDEDP